MARKKSVDVDEPQETVLVSPGGEEYRTTSRLETTRLVSRGYKVQKSPTNTPPNNTLPTNTPPNGDSSN